MEVFQLIALLIWRLIQLVALCLWVVACHPIALFIVNLAFVGKSAHHIVHDSGPIVWVAWVVGIVNGLAALFWGGFIHRQYFSPKVLDKKR